MKPITLLLLIFLSYSSSYSQTPARHTVYFATNNDVISQEEQKRLDAFIDGISEKYVEGIDVNGHTDSDGGDSFNIALSQRRVESVQKQLSKIDFNSTEISEMFHGESQPAEANTSSIGKRNNRNLRFPFIDTRPELFFRAARSMNQLFI